MGHTKARAFCLVVVLGAIGALAAPRALAQTSQPAAPAAPPFEQGLYGQRQNRWPPSSLWIADSSDAQVYGTWRMASDERAAADPAKPRPLTMRESLRQLPAGRWGGATDFAKLEDQANLERGASTVRMGFDSAGNYVSPDRNYVGYTDAAGRIYVLHRPWTTERPDRSTPPGALAAQEVRDEVTNRTIDRLGLRPYVAPAAFADRTKALEQATKVAAPVRTAAVPAADAPRSSFSFDEERYGRAIDRWPPASLWAPDNQDSGVYTWENMETRNEREWRQSPSNWKRPAYDASTIRMGFDAAGNYVSSDRNYAGYVDPRGQVFVLHVSGPEFNGSDQERIVQRTIRERGLKPLVAPGAFTQRVEARGPLDEATRPFQTLDRAPTGLDSAGLDLGKPRAPEAPAPRALDSTAPASKSAYQLPLLAPIEIDPSQTAAGWTPPAGAPAVARDADVTRLEQQLGVHFADKALAAAATVTDPAASPRVTSGVLDGAAYRAKLWGNPEVSVGDVWVAATIRGQVDSLAAKRAPGVAVDTTAVVRTILENEPALLAQRGVATDGDGLPPPSQAGAADPGLAATLVADGLAPSSADVLALAIQAARAARVAAAANPTTELARALLDQGADDADAERLAAAIKSRGPAKGFTQAIGAANDKLAERAASEGRGGLDGAR